MIYLIIAILSIALLVFIGLYVKWRIAYRRLLKKSLVHTERSFDIVETVDFSAVQSELPMENEMLSDLQRLMEQEKIFLQKDLTIVKLAKQLGTNRATLSHLINSRFHKNFPKFLNEYRVKEAIKLLSDEKTGNYKIEVIGDMCGYKNRQVFHSSFKRETGVTPTQYREMESAKESRQCLLERKVY